MVEGVGVVVVGTVEVSVEDVVLVVVAACVVCSVVVVEVVVDIVVTGVVAIVAVVVAIVVVVVVIKSVWKANCQSALIMSSITARKLVGCEVWCVGKCLNMFMCTQKQNNVTACAYLIPHHISPREQVVKEDVDMALSAAGWHVLSTKYLTA